MTRRPAAGAQAGAAAGDTNAGTATSNTKVAAAPGGGATPRQRRAARRWPIWGGIVLALGILCGTLLLLLHERRDLVRDQQQRHTLLARVLEDHATRSVDSTLLALRSVADLLVSQIQPEVTQAMLQQTLASLPFLRGVAVLGPDGQVLASTDAGEAGLLVDVSRLGPVPAPGRDGTGRFVAARSLAGLERGRAAPPVPTGVGFVPLMRAERLRSGRPVLVVGLLNPDALANFQQITLADERSAAALAALDGSVLASTPNASRAPGERLDASGGPLAAIRAGAEHGVWEGPGLRPDPQLGAFRALRGRPLAVLLETDREAIESAWRAEVVWIGSLALATAAIVLGLSALAAHHLRGRDRARLQLDEAQARVAARERELSAIVGSVQDLLFRTDLSGRITFVNDRFQALSGKDPAAALGHPLHDLFGNDAQVAALFVEPPAAGSQQPRARQVRARWSGIGGSPRGPKATFDITLVPLLDPRAAGGYAGWAGSAVDVSRLLAVQDELRLQLGFARSLLANTPLPTSVLDLEGRYIDVNRAWEAFTGRRRAEVLGQLAAAYLTPEEAALHELHDRHLRQHGGERHYETRWHAPDGSTRDVFINKSAYADAQGRVAGIVVAFMDISEFREAERATRRARDAALAASEAKTEFIGNMSHELRTPLQSILGFSELGRHRARAQPALAGMFDDVHRAGQRMLALVNDLLDLAKIESGSDTFELERADIRPLVEDVLHELQPQCTARSIEVRLQTSDGALVALVDAPKFQQVVRNVLANAIRFSPAGAAIEVACDVDPADVNQLLLTIADRGPGIPPAELELIFEAFVQSSATKDGSGGTGLGLAICRRIMAAHDGHIRAHNRDGGGSVFSVGLPAASFGDTRPASL